MSIYQNKDIRKFEYCNKMITRGAVGSSSHKYQYSKILGDKIVNDDNYSNIDIVGVSVNGKRNNRLTFDKKLVRIAFRSGAVIVCDNTYNRNRSFNIGERELNTFLRELNAECFEDSSFRSCWKLV